MDRDSAFDAVKTVLCDDFGYPPDPVTEAASLRDDIGMDSLDLIDLVTALENRFDGQVQQVQITAVRTIADVVDIVLLTAADT